MRPHLLMSALLLSIVVVASPGQRPLRAEGEAWRGLPAGQLPADSRLGEVRKLRDKYHPWTPAATRQQWEKQREAVREQVLVATGLWPLPPKPPLKPVVHGKIDRGQYTIEKVYFASHPGHYVTGNLYRPAKIEGKVPGILCPHGHWRNGRFYDAGPRGARRQIDQGAEDHMAGARFPVQARMVQLAKLGCVVFHYDMVGYADSGQIPHRQGFTDAEAGLRLQNFMGLQTFNSIRALDFLLSLPEVDANRIAVTGSSGGGTQTFMICAVDPRPAAAFPAVMVSTNMQGGCVCENASYLRIGINNIAITALFAPKPLAMSGADDWTIDIETKGLPELKHVYSLYGKAGLVHAKAFPQFGHNYNQRAREMMYDWFNRHLGLGWDGPIAEEDFWPVPPEELSVWDEKHPVPDDAVSAAKLRDYLTRVAETQFQKLLPETSEQFGQYQRVVATAARVMLDRGVPSADDVEATDVTTSQTDFGQFVKGLVGRRGANEAVPFVQIVPANHNGRVVLWIDGRGKSHLFGDDGRPTQAVRELLQGGTAVASADVFLTGEFVQPGQPPRYPEVDKNYHGFTFGYNRPVLSSRVRDILTLIGLLARDERYRSIRLAGTGEAGPWVLLAAALAGDQVDETAADAGGFRFANVTATSDPMFLPGALKYGGLMGLTALAAPQKLTVAGMKPIPADERTPLQKAYAATKGELRLIEEPLSDSTVTRLLAQ